LSISLVFPDDLFIAMILYSSYLTMIILTLISVMSLIGITSQEFDFDQSAPLINF